MRFPDLLVELYKISYRLNRLESDVDSLFRMVRQATKDTELSVPERMVQLPLWGPNWEVVERGSAEIKRQLQKAEGSAKAVDLGDELGVRKPRRRGVDK